MIEKSYIGGDEQPFCRLKFAFSASGHRCVIFRRGPSKSVRMILWDLKKNEFSYGQWLNGPISHFDISPKADHVIYFVSYHKKRAPYLWVALSKPPYFSALSMWPISDAWGGACAFIDESSICIEKGMYQADLKLNTRFHLKNYNFVDKTNIWSWKMERDGWVAHNQLDRPKKHGVHQVEWRKQSPKMGLTLCWQLRRSAEPKHKYWLLESRGEIVLTDTDCADFHPDGRLAISQNGRLLMKDITNKGLLTTVEIADFNDQWPENIIAPHSAKRW